MRTTLFLRIASVLTFIHAALHTIGGVFGGVAPGAMQTAVSAMKGNEFVAMGVTRNFWDFYMGLGLAVTVFMTVEAVVFWQLGSLAKTDALRLRPVLATFLVGFSGHGRGLVPVLLCGAGDHGDIDRGVSRAGHCRCKATG